MSAYRSTGPVKETVRLRLDWLQTSSGTHLVEKGQLYINSTVKVTYFFKGVMSKSRHYFL